MDKGAGDQPRKAGIARGATNVVGQLSASVLPPTHSKTHMCSGYLHLSMRMYYINIVSTGCGLSC